MASIVRGFCGLQFKTDEILVIRFVMQQDGNSSPAYPTPTQYELARSPARCLRDRPASPSSPIVFHSTGSTPRPVESLGHVSCDMLTRSPVAAAASGRVKNELGQGSWQYSGVRGSHGPREEPCAANALSRTRNTAFTFAATQQAAAILAIMTSRIILST